jgi:hypothetical protein
MEEIRDKKDHKFSIGVCECPKCFNEVLSASKDRAKHYRICDKCNHQFYYQYSGGEISGFFTTSRNTTSLVTS